MFLVPVLTNSAVDRCPRWLPVLHIPRPCSAGGWGWGGVASAALSRSAPLTRHSAQENGSAPKATAKRRNSGASEVPSEPGVPASSPTKKARKLVGGAAGRAAADAFFDRTTPKMRADSKLIALLKRHFADEYGILSEYENAGSTVRNAFNTQVRRRASEDQAAAAQTLREQLGDETRKRKAMEKERDGLVERQAKEAKRRTSGRYSEAANERIATLEAQRQTGYKKVNKANEKIKELMAKIETLESAAKPRAEMEKLSHLLQAKCHECAQVEDQLKELEKQATPEARRQVQEYIERVEQMEKELEEKDSMRLETVDRTGRYSAHIRLMYYALFVIGGVRADRAEETLRTPPPPAFAQLCTLSSP